MSCIIHARVTQYSVTNIIVPIMQMQKLKFRESSHILGTLCSSCLNLNSCILLCVIGDDKCEKDNTCQIKVWNKLFTKGGFMQDKCIN